MTTVSGLKHSQATQLSFVQPVCKALLRLPGPSIRLMPQMSGLVPHPLPLTVSTPLLRDFFLEVL